MRARLLALMLLTAGCCGAQAGTLLLKDGDSVSDVQIISIEGDRLVIEKDSTRKTISMSKVKGYYYTDVKGSGSFEADVSDYKVSISDVKMPTYSTSTEKKGSHSTTSKQENCTIVYTISKEGEKSNLPRIKEPYFYIYVMLEGDKEHGERPVYCFYYPTKQAKPKGKSSNKGGYDKAAILATLGNFDRPIINMNNTENKSLSGREITIPFKSLPQHRKIMAWHVEVYGNSDLIQEKNWHDFDGPKGEWWKTY